MKFSIVLLAAVLFPCTALALEEVSLTADFGQVGAPMRGGFGASWHAIETPMPVTKDRSHGGSAWGGYPAAGDDAAWRQVYQHADWLGMDFCRVEIEQRVYQPEEDRFTWDSPEMAILYRILDWCESRKVNVFFQQMWGNVQWNAFPEFRSDPIRCLHSGPYSMDAYAAGLAELMKHLVKTKQYTCIRWLSINNEPGHAWSWWQRPPNESMPLRPGLEATRKALDQAGVRVPLSGPDWTDLPALDTRKIDFSEFITAYDLHSYGARFDWTSGEGYTLSKAEEHLRAWQKRAQAEGKPLFLTELGSMFYGKKGSSPGPACYESAIKDAELVVRALRIGVEGFNRWSFINRGDLDGQWQMIDTWDPVADKLLERYTPKPNSYFVYGLISRFSAKDSALAASEVTGGQIDGIPRVFSAALRSPQGQTTWMIVNDAPQAWQAKVKLTGAAPQRAWHRYQVSAAQKDNAALEIAPTALGTPGGSFSQELPAMSLTIFSTYQLAHADKGVMTE